MPYKRVYKRKQAPYRKRLGARVGGPRKRVGIRRAGLRKRMSRPSIRTQPTSFPDKMRVKLHYDTSYVTTNAASLYTVIQLRGNSLYDPETILGGANPYSFDAWSNFYNKYRVYGSAVRVTTYPTGTTNLSTTQQLIVVPTANSSDALTATIDVATQMPYSKNNISNLYKGPATISSYMSTRKIHGIDKAQFGREYFEAQVTSNPTRMWFWNILNGPIVSGETCQNVYKIRITYYAEFYDRKVTP